MLNLIIVWISQKVYLKFSKTPAFPESLLPLYPSFYETWNKFWTFIDPILNLEFYDVFYSALGDVAYYRYRKLGIDTVEDFLLFCCSHTKRECNILLSENKSKSYTRDICFNRLRELINEKCYGYKVPHREEALVLS